VCTQAGCARDREYEYLADRLSRRLTVESPIKYLVSLQDDVQYLSIPISTFLLSFC